MNDPDFTEYLEPHYDDAVNYCRALCSGSTRAEAEDVIQQALLRACEHFDTLENPDRFRPWLFRIITRTFYNTVRRPYWSRFIPFSSYKPSPLLTIYDEGYFGENQALTRALSCISAKQRAAILLFEIGGFSVREIAELQGEKSESTVRSRLKRTREKLKRIMEQDAQNGSGGTAVMTRLERGSTDFLGETHRIINELKAKG